MEIKAYLIHSMYDIEEFNIKVTELNFIKVRLKLEEQKNIIINILKDMKSKDLIKSIRRPKNKKFKKEINTLIEIKKNIKKSINYINNVFR